MGDTNRRSLLGRAVALTTMGALAGSALVRSKARAQSAAGTGTNGVRALVFDVFGTVVDWRGGVAREAEAILKPRGYALDWIAFADAWRALYQPTMEGVRSGREPFVKLDVLHRRMLEQIRPRFGLEKLDEPVLRELTLAWHRLDAWKDVAAGFARLHRRYVMAPCSNGNIALMVDVGRRNNLPWDAILGSEIARDYKPKPRVYLSAAEALGLRPDEVMMVAAHSDDLHSAASNGLRTAHVARPQESPTGEAGPRGTVDFAARDFSDLADKIAA
jgi:2-haloacid dehalogenase